LLNGARRTADNHCMTDVGGSAATVDGPYERARRVFDAAGVPTATFDGEGHVVAINPAFAQLCGRAPGELIGLHLMALCPGRDQADVLSTLVRLVGGVSDIEQEELRVVGSDGRVRVLSVTLGSLHDGDGRVDRVLAVGHDLTQDRRAARRRRRERIDSARESLEDAETGLPNDRALTLLVASAVRRSASTGAPFALLRCDVTNLDEIEHRHGATATRSVLDVVAERLAQRLRGSDTVTRSGTGTFSVLAEDLGDVQDAAGVAYRLLATVVEPVRDAGADVDVALTVGVAVGDGDASPSVMLSDAADAARGARQDGGGGFRLRDGRVGAPA
jgi:PAS domain S-box-containing protein/diguanylate cyclase (GGDEF)-like protein